MTRERPILTSGPMVRAIIDGRKSVTRRVMQPQPSYTMGEGNPPTWGRGFSRVGWANGDENRWHPDWLEKCPYGAPGDRLWVRETFWWNHTEATQDNVAYRADGEMPDHMNGTPWRPSIHMPRWASRITLEVTEVRVERLQEIADGDALDEGVTEQVAGLDVDIDGYWWAGRPRARFRELWDSLNAARGYGWDANPWVWVVRFRRLTP